MSRRNTRPKKGDKRKRRSNSTKSEDNTTPGKDKNSSRSTGGRNKEKESGDNATKTNNENKSVRSKSKIVPSLFQFYKIGRIFPKADDAAADHQHAEDVYNHSRRLATIKLVKSCRAYCCWSKEVLMEFKYEITIALQALCLLMGIIFFFVSIHVKETLKDL